MRKECGCVCVYIHIYIYMIYLRACVCVCMCVTGSLLCTEHCKSTIIKKNLGVSVMAQWLTNPSRNHEVAGSIPGLAQWIKDLVLL